MIAPSSRRISVISRVRAGARCSRRSLTICSSSMACAPNASHTMRIRAFPTLAGRASRGCRPTPFGTIARMPRPWRASIRARRRCCVSPGMALASARMAPCGAARRCWDGPAPGRALRASDRSACPAASVRAREPWRTALGLCWESGQSWPEGASLGDPLLRAAWERGVNAPTTTSVGRLFDAAAALLGVCLHASYEGEAPMRLEALAQDADRPWRRCAAARTRCERHLAQRLGAAAAGAARRAAWTRPLAPRCFTRVLRTPCANRRLRCASTAASRAWA